MQGLWPRLVPWRMTVINMRPPASLLSIAMRTDRLTMNSAQVTLVREICRILRAPPASGNREKQ